MQRNDLLLKQYRQEKNLIVGDDLFENFPTFQEWKREYVEEYNQTHQTVPVVLADKMMDHIVTEADVELIKLTNRSKVMSKNKSENNSNQIGEYTEKFMNNINNSDQSNKKNKKTTVKKDSKAGKCREIFYQNFGQKSRGEIVKLFIRDGGMTENGAKTYYQNFKKEFENKSEE